MPSIESRKRVSFSTTVDVRNIPSYADSASSDHFIEETQESIMNRLMSAFESKSKNQSFEYHEICEYLSTHKSISSANLHLWISSLSLMVSNLSPTHCKRLIDIVLSIPWISKDDPFVNTYISFLEVLVSAHSVHTASVCKMLIQLFRFGNFKY